MASTKVIYKSVTLQPGEQFTLPPGAELTGATSPDNIDSTCTDNVVAEELACYAFVIGVQPSSGEPSELYEPATNSNLRLIGIKLNGVKYLFNNVQSASAPFSLYNLANVVTELNSTTAGSVAFNTSTGFSVDNSRGSLNYIVFKTIPSIGNNLSILAETAAPIFDNVSNPNDQVKLEFPARLYSDISDFEGLPSCS